MTDYQRKTIPLNFGSFRICFVLFCFSASNPTFPFPSSSSSCFFWAFSTDRFSSLSFPDYSTGRSFWSPCWHIGFLECKRPQVWLATLGLCGDSHTVPLSMSSPDTFEIKRIAIFGCAIWMRDRLHHWSASTTFVNV